MNEINRMKKLGILLFLVICFNSIVNAQTKTPMFRQYLTKVEKIKNLQLNLKSHQQAKMFHTKLREAAAEGVNFAGHYILATWGCGTNCSQSAIIDARSGTVFFPSELEGNSFGFCDLPIDLEPLVYKANSRLLILNGSKGGDQDANGRSCGIYYLEWMGARFKQIEFVEKENVATWLNFPKIEKPTEDMNVGFSR